MATTTTTFSLRKPATTDVVDVTTDISDNMDTIDTNLGNHKARHKATGGDPIAAYGAGVVSNANQNLTSGTINALNMQAEAFDSDGLHTSSEAKITVNVTGKYLVEGCWYCEANATGYREAWIYVDAVANKYNRVPSVGGSQPTSVPIARVIPLTAGQFVDLRGLQNSGVDLLAAAGAWLSVTYLGT